MSAFSALLKGLIRQYTLILPLISSSSFNNLLRLTYSSLYFVATISSSEVASFKCYFKMTVFSFNDAVSPAASANLSTLTYNVSFALSDSFSYSLSAFISFMLKPFVRV